MKQKIKTESITKDLGRRSGEIQDRIGQVVKLVNEKMTAKNYGPDKYDQAFSEVRAEHKDLFASMEPVTDK